MGNSHLACVLAAAERAGISLTPIVLKESRYFEGLSQRVEYAQPRKLAERLAQEGGDGPVYSFVGGTRHLAVAFRRNPRPYDVYLPAAPDLPFEEGAEIIPVAALRAALAKSMEPHLEALATLNNVARGRVIHFEPPPPPAIQWWDSDHDRSAKPRKSVPYLRYKLWRLNSEIVREHVVRDGGTFVESPSAARDDDGLLRPEFVANSTHANVEYGALVLDQMQAAA